MADPVDHSWSVVLQGKRQILGINGVDDEEEYDEQFNNSVPSSFDIPTTVVDNVTTFRRQDHDEGIFVNRDKV